EDRVHQVLYQFIPAVGQGSLAIEIRYEDVRVREAINFLDHEESRLRAVAERAFLAEVHGGCQVPMGAYAWIENGLLMLKAFISDLEGKRFFEGLVQGKPQEAENLGRSLARRLLKEGGEEIIKELYGDI
ncbi:MAG: hydroxymethylbilane synthase, partial [Aquificaceae bacterium]|nr:hydroxymethylbilane synthase [Aquificaceae bacterium]